MITLSTKIIDLSAEGLYRNAGDYICHTSAEEEVDGLGVTIGIQGELVKIIGGNSFCADILGEDLITITVSERPWPIVCTASTRIACLPRLGADRDGDWRSPRADELDPTLHLIIAPYGADRGRGIDLGGERIANVRRETSRADKYDSKSSRTLVTLRLGDSKWFTTPSGVVHV